MTCPRCEKEGECELQNLVYEYGVEETQYPWSRIPFPADDLSPLIQRDGNKCILCGRCVRICDEVQGVGELSFTERGIETSIDTDFHRALECEFCGQCLDTCPVGAITTDRFDSTVKAWELTETTSPCPYCACGCLLTFGSKEGSIKRVFSDPAPGRAPYRANDGNLCVKGRFGWDFVDHPERLKTPLIRHNGTFKEASWEEALRFVAERLEGVRDQHGADAAAGLASSRLTNEEHFLFQTLFRKALGTEQIDPGGTGIERGLAEGLTRTLGLPASTNSIREIRNADCLMVIGTDPAETHPIIRNEIHLAIRHRRAQLIVLGQRDIGLARATQISPLFHPSVLLLAKPGTEAFILNTVIQTILKEGLENTGFILERTEGMETLKRSISKLDLRTLSEDIRKEAERAARAFAKAKRAMILVGSGFGSPLQARDVAIAASNLALITGHIGRESSGLLLLLDKCNSQGTIDMGHALQEAGGTSGDLFEKAAGGKIKALYAVGADPIPASGEPDGLRKILAGLELLVVQDLFMTQTAKLAHVVLPACAFVEKTGTFTNLERRVQKIHPLRPPQGDSRSDFDIFRDLLQRLECVVPGNTPEEIFEEIGRIHPAYAGIRDGEQWPKGASLLYGDRFPKGKAKLLPVEKVAPSPTTDAQPFHLIRKASLFQSGLLSQRSEALEMVLETLVKVKK
jgi:predicted molibdopterin-dependent oxidoreductase YjgC